MMTASHDVSNPIALCQDEHDKLNHAPAGWDRVVAEVNVVKGGESAGWPEIYCAVSIVILEP